MGRDSCERERPEWTESGPPLARPRQSVTALYRMPSLTSRTTVQSIDTQLRANTRANARAAIREDETGRLLAITQSEHACSKSFSEQPKCLARHTRHTPRPTDTPEGMLAAQDEVAEKARALWAADRVACRLAKAVSLVRDGKQPKDGEMVLAALEKFKAMETDLEQKVAATRSRRADAAAQRADAILQQREAGEAKEASVAQKKKAAAAARQAIRSERERRQLQRSECIAEKRRAAELNRRKEQQEVYVEREWKTQQSHVHARVMREVERRKHFRQVQEREAEELEHADGRMRALRVAQLEKEQENREATDAQVIKALPGHHAKLMGHAKNIAPYALQLREHGYRLSRWRQDG